jgi:hypothetical protein
MLFAVHPLDLPAAQAKANVQMQHKLFSKISSRGQHQAEVSLPKDCQDLKTKLKPNGTVEVLSCCKRCCCVGRHQTKAIINAEEAPEV